MCTLNTFVIRACDAFKHAALNTLIFAGALNAFNFRPYKCACDAFIVRAFNSYKHAAFDTLIFARALDAYNT